MKPTIPISEGVDVAALADEPAIGDNRFSINLFIVAFLLTGVALAWLTWSAYDLYKGDTAIREQAWRAGELRTRVIHLDEVLTMSARMAATTSDPHWEERYRIFEPQLDEAIKEMRALTPSQMIAETDAANIKLEEMQNQAFTLVRDHHAEKANAILSSERYETQKRIYADGMSKFFLQIENQLNATHRAERSRAVFSTGAGIAVLAILLFSGLAIMRRLYRAHAVLVSNIAKRKQAEDVLRIAHHELAIRVQERTADLTTANSALKEEIGERRQAEEKLSRLAAIVESSDDAIISKTLDGIITSWNEGARRLYGYSASEVIGQPISILADSIDELPEILKDIKLGQFLKHYETLRVGQDGTHINLDLSLSPIKDAAGATIGVSIFARVITERKHAEQLLTTESTLARVLAESVSVAEAATHFLRAICENLQWDAGAFWSVDRELKVLRCEEFWHSPAINVTDFQSFSRRTRFPPGQGLPGRVWQSGAPVWISDMCEDTNFPRMSVAAREGLRGAVAFPVQVGREVLGVMEFFCSEVRQRDAPLLRMMATAGNHLGQFVERKRAEEELRESEERYRLLFENNPHPMWVYDLETLSFSAINGAAIEHYGYSREEFLAMTVEDIRPPEDAPALRADLSRVNQRVAGIGRHRKKDGSIIDVEITAHEFLFAGRRAELVLANDVTERRMLEVQLRQAQKLESMGQLAAGIAHEINTPTQYVGDNLRFIQESYQAYSEVMEKYGELFAAAQLGPVSVGLVAEVGRVLKDADLEYVAVEVPKALNQSLEGVERIAKIVQSMKDFAHPDATEKKAADLNRAIESTINVARGEWKYVAELETDFDPNLPPVPCLLGELNQMTLNMIINAAHAIGGQMKVEGQDKGLIKISTRQEGDWVVLRISDTGGGIPLAIRARIFDPFFTTKEVGKGTGQGLAISHAVVEKHGGTITFETSEGEGTTFIIRLPLHEIARTPDGLAQEAA